MRRTSNAILTFLLPFVSTVSLFAQEDIVNQLNSYGDFENWSVREIKESGIIGGDVTQLFEFCGDRETVKSREPFRAPEGYLWRTNNVLAVVAGVTKTSTTVFPEKRGDGYCARIETHMEEVSALGVVNMKVTCQGAFFIGTLQEPIKDTKSPLKKVEYGVPFEGRPVALSFDFKSDVGHETIRGTGFSPFKAMGYPDYPQAMIILQKRWENPDGSVQALRVGTGIKRFTVNQPEWLNGYTLNVNYGDITSEPYYKDYMGLNNDEKTAYYCRNSQGKLVLVEEVGWASADEEPNYLIINFLSSCGEAFYGGVGNTLWLDNISLIME